MIDALKEIFEEAAQLPEDEQRHIAEVMREAIVVERRWQTLLHDPKSEAVLRDLVAEAFAEDAAGETEESFLSLPPVESPLYDISL